MLEAQAGSSISCLSIRSKRSHGELMDAVGQYSQGRSVEKRQRDGTLAVLGVFVSVFLIPS